MLQKLEQTQFDETRAGDFADAMADTLCAGALTLMISLGHRTGLFDTMSKMKPASSTEIAEEAELNERYVREWLSAMVTGRIVEYDPVAKTYFLPAEHAASLTREGAMGNLAVYAQLIPASGAAQEKVLAGFETGQGTSYDDYPCFHEIMAEDSGQAVLPHLLESVLPLAPGLSERLLSGIDVLDAGCGRGRALMLLAEAFPASRFTGYDLCTETIDWARRQASAKGLTNVDFHVRDLTGYDEPDRWDFITTFDAVHDQKDPQALLHGLFRSLRQGGTYIMQDIGGSAFLEKNLDFPFATFLYTASCFHCMPVSLGQGGVGLGTMWGWETAQAMLAEAGFSSAMHIIEGDPMNVWFVSRKD